MELSFKKGHQIPIREDGMFGKGWRKAWIGGLVGASMALTAPAMSDTTLKFISWQVDEPGIKEWWQGIIGEFEAAHPGVTIDFTKVARENYLDTMITLFASGSPPDIAHLAVFEVGPIAENGWLEDLGPRIAASDIPIDDWAGRSKCIWEGKEVCIILLYFGGIMAYNQAMLDEEGLSVPTDWDGFIDAARKLTKDTDGDGITDQFGVGHHTVAGGSQYISEMLPYILDSGASWTTEEGKPAFDTPEMVEGLRRWKLVIDERLTPLDLAAGEVRQLFADGRVALRVDGPWLYGTMKRATPETFQTLKIAKTPFTPPYGGTSNGIAIPSEISEERKDLVWAFIQVVTSEKWQKQYPLTGGMPAPRPDAVPSDVYEEVPHFDLIVETMQEASAAGVDRVPLGFESNFGEFSKIIQDETIRMIIEDLDPADAAMTIQDKLVALQARN